jgi:mycoredoxin
MSNVLMYGAEWCGDCRRSKRFLDSNNVEYTYIDVEADKSAADKVVEINGGAQSIPVIVFSDGTHLTEPSDIDLKASCTITDVSKISFFILSLLSAIC